MPGVGWMGLRREWGGEVEDEELALVLKDTMKEAGRFLLKIVRVEAEVVVVGSWAEK